MKRQDSKTSRIVPKVVPKQKSYSDIWMGGILAIIAFALYCNTLNHGFVMDDFAAIGGNKFIQKGFKGFHQILTTSYWSGMSAATGGIYRPLSLLMFAAEWQFSPNNPLPGHWINVLLYALTGFVLYFFVKKIAPNSNPLFAFSVSLLWIVHPLHTEVVANIKSRDEILCFLFGISSLYQAINYIERKKLLHIIWMTLFFALALISKESALCYVLIIPFTLYFFTNAVKRDYISILIPIGICTLLFLIIRSSVLGSVYQTIAIPVNDNSLAGANSLSQRYATTIYILGYYIFKFFIPISFASDYSYNQIPLISFSNPFAILSFLIYIFLVFYAFKNLKGKDRISYGIFFFLFGIALVSNVFFLLGSTMGERFMYLPSLGISIAFITLSFKIFKIDTITSLPETTKMQLFQSKPFLFILIISAMFLSFKTFNRNMDWKSDYTLFSKDVQTVTENAKMKYFYERAIMDHVKYNKLDPAKQKTELESALYQMNQAIKIDSNYYLLYNSTAELYTFQKDYQKAIECYKKSIKINKGNVDSYGNLGNIYFRTQQYDSAEYYQSKAIALNPTSYLNYFNLGGVQFQLQHYEDAIKSYQKAIQLHSTYVDAYKNLGTAYNFIKKYDEAIINYNKVLSLDPKNATAYFYLGLVYENKGDLEKAAFYKNKAKALDPGIK